MVDPGRIRPIDCWVSLYSTSTSGVQESVVDMKGYTWFITGWVPICDNASDGVDVDVDPPVGITYSASRGIGLELTRQLLQSPMHTVFASCRSPSSATDLLALSGSGPGTLHVVEMDVADEGSIERGARGVMRVLDGRGLDYVINNAGVNPAKDTAFTFDPAHLTSCIVSNVIGPALVSRYLLPAIERSERRVIVNVTSSLASVGKDCGGKSASYSVSKMALNMLTYKQAKERPDLIPVLIDPGWVKTRMGGEGAMLEPRTSVEGILEVVMGVTKGDAGKFYNYQGKEIPW